jgi:hypothetical protein
MIGQRQTTGRLPAGSGRVDGLLRTSRARIGLQLRYNRYHDEALNDLLAFHTGLALPSGLRAPAATLICAPQHPVAER